MLPRMSIGQWFKNLFSSSRTDAPADVANETDYEQMHDDARLAAGGGVPGVGYAALEAETVVEGLSDEDAPSDHAS